MLNSRWFLPAMLALLSLGSPALARPAASDKLPDIHILNGSEWKNLNQQSKRAFLQGFTNACQEIDYFSKEAFDRATEKAKKERNKSVQNVLTELDGQFFGMNKDLSVFAANRPEELLEELGNFYRDRANAKIPVTFAIFYAASKHKGATKPRLAEMLDGMRATVQR